MNAEPSRAINIDGKLYDAEALSKTCVEKLNAVQTTRRALSLLGSLINHAQYGLAVDLKEAIKLLPDPLPEAPSSLQAEGDVED